MSQIKSLGYTKAADGSRTQDLLHGKQIAAFGQAQQNRLQTAEHFVPGGLVSDGARWAGITGGPIASSSRGLKDGVRTHRRFRLALSAVVRRCGSASTIRTARCDFEEALYASR